MVLQPRVDAPHQAGQAGRSTEQDSLGTRIEPVPASETDSSESQVVQPKADNKMTIIDDEYSYESYYSESATAQAKQTGVPHHASEPSMVSHSAVTSLQGVQPD